MRELKGKNAKRRRNAEQSEALDATKSPAGDGSRKAMLFVEPARRLKEYYKRVPEPKFDVGEAINWMMAHTPKEQLDKICEVTAKAVAIMESGARKYQPFTDKLINTILHKEQNDGNEIH